MLRIANDQNVLLLANAFFIEIQLSFVDFLHHLSRVQLGSSRQHILCLNSIKSTQFCKCDHAVTEQPRLGNTRLKASQTQHMACQRWE